MRHEYLIIIKMTTLLSKNPIDIIYPYTSNIDDKNYIIRVFISDREYYRLVILTIENDTTYIARSFRDFGTIHDKNGNVDIDNINFIVECHIENNGITHFGDYY